MGRVTATANKVAEASEAEGPVIGSSRWPDESGRGAALRLCVPVSSAFRTCAQTLLGLVDAVSFKEPSEETYHGKKHFLECSLNIGDPHLPEKLEKLGIANALRQGKYEAFACDINAKCDYVSGESPNGRPWAYPCSPPVADEIYLERASRNGAWIRKQYQGYIQLENLNYFPTGAYERVCEASFISQVLTAAGAGLLLDVAHALISAHYLGYGDPLDYFADLPLGKIRDVQLSRPAQISGVYEDLHEAPSDQEWALLTTLVQIGMHAEYLSIEYYREPKVLVQTYERACEMAGT